MAYPRVTPHRRAKPSTADSIHSLPDSAEEDRGNRRSHEEVDFMNVDKTLTCADCSQAFTFTASEQDFYAERGFTEPRRCPSCRASRKAARNSDGGGGYSAGGGYSSGGGGYSSGAGYSSSGGAGGYGASRGGGGSRGPREMFAATCSSCGQETEVPFRPTSGKPVYCSACFAQRRA
jgi:CxxC-x17-CxxC domain-containing protein